MAQDYSKCYQGFQAILDGDKYECKLVEKSKKKAKEELHEDDKERDAAVEQLRTWIKEQPHLTACTETTFLLQFLRRCKFSQLEARKMFDNFHTKICDQLPFWMCNIDVHKPALRDLITNQRIYVHLPHRDDEGRRIFLCQLGRFDVGKDILYNFHDYIAYSGVTMMVSNREEETQVNGYVIFLDLTDQTMKHMTFMPIEFRRKLFGLFSNQLPARIKSMIMYNAGPVWETMWNLAGHFVSAKIKERMSYCKTMEEVYKLIPMRCLPREYLPDDYNGPCAGNLADIASKKIQEKKQNSKE
ncbi:unnamed protein product [Owenia fusiformis]|uniref:CRAL-TRIO domain-containing protein n=2 Tax=Owenia fusiformis TaxID=6347 RepID=A0A8S4NJI9_OWEFU|nr:unnamed protein product [Owenia fusiformis]